MREEINCEYTNEIVCPHCGDKTAWDYEGGEVFEQDCDNCDKEFRVTLNHEVTFSTSKFDREDEEAERQRRIQEHKRCDDKLKAECAAFTPGMRVRVGERTQQNGRTGVVENRELGVMVHVRLDRLDSTGACEYVRCFRPSDLEKLDD